MKKMVRVNTMHPVKKKNQVAILDKDKRQLKFSDGTRIMKSTAHSVKKV